MTIKYKDSVEALVVTAISTQTSVKVINTIMTTKSVENWSKRRVDALLKVYDSKDEIQKLWNRFVKFREHYNQYFPGDLFNGKYHLVRCPVLIIHGDQVYIYTN